MTLPSNELSTIAKKIKFFACDIDGVMTDGGIILSEYQGEYKRFDVQDGMGITMIRKAGLKTGIITGRVSDVVRKRAEELNFDEICQGFFWKEKALENILEKYQLAEEEIAYVGDDIRDITAANSAGMISVAALYGFIEDLQQVKEWGSDYMINKPLDLENLIV